MNKKVVLALTLLVMSMLVVPMAYSAPLSNDWFIQNAREFVNTEYLADHQEISYSGAVVSGWETHGVQCHKHVVIETVYKDSSYHDDGHSYLYCRVYSDGTCYTNTFTDSPPIDHITFKQKIVYLDLYCPYGYVDGHPVTYTPINYKNYGNETIYIHFTDYGYNYTFKLKPEFCLSIYTPYNPII